MTFEDVMGQVMQWATATDALAALGAQLQLQQPGAGGHPEIVAALEEVSAVAGLSGLDELPPPQQMMVVGLIRMFLHQAVDVVDQPAVAPGWTVTDPAILDGWGRGSMMVPMLIAGAHPDLREVGSLLDVGTGVGLLAVSAANVWPASAVVGIDPWDVSLARARENVSGAGLDDRITLRQQALADIDDVDAFDCVWVPTFFLTEEAVEVGIDPAFRALRPGGWIVLGRMRPSPDPMATATEHLRWTRSGGSALDTQRCIELLEKAGFENVHAAAPAGPAPMELVLGQRSAG